MRWCHFLNKTSQQETLGVNPASPWTLLPACYFWCNNRPPQFQYREELSFKTNSVQCILTEHAAKCVVPFFSSQAADRWGYTDSDLHTCFTEPAQFKKALLWWQKFKHSKLLKTISRIYSGFAIFHIRDVKKTHVLFVCSLFLSYPSTEIKKNCRTMFCGND